MIPPDGKITVPGDGPVLNRAARRKTKAKVDQTSLVYDCKACGARLVVIPTKLASKKPKAANRMLESAGIRHRAQTGCFRGHGS